MNAKTSSKDKTGHSERKTAKLYLGTNTKMYMGIHDTVNYIQKLTRRLGPLPHEKLTLFIIPSFTALERACQVSAGILIGAQNMGWADEGAFTGEVSPNMLREVGVKIVEIGHSERRQLFHETDQEENQKVLTAMRHGLTPLLCVGETYEQKQCGAAEEVLQRQLSEGLKHVKCMDGADIWIAYEPVWAIGEVGVPASAAYAQKQLHFIRTVLSQRFGAQIGEKIPLLYGGSVHPDNAVELIRQPDIDGLFIGRSAWKIDSFLQIIHDVLNAV